MLTIVQRPGRGPGGSPEARGRGGIGGRWPAGALGALARGLDAHPCRGDPSSPKSHLQSPGRRPLVLWSARVFF